VEIGKRSEGIIGKKKNLPLFSSIREGKKERNRTPLEGPGFREKGKGDVHASEDAVERKKLSFLHRGRRKEIDEFSHFMDAELSTQKKKESLSRRSKNSFTAQEGKRDWRAKGRSSQRRLCGENSIVEVLGPESPRDFLRVKKERRGDDETLSEVISSPMHEGGISAPPFSLEEEE